MACGRSSGPELRQPLPDIMGEMNGMQAMRDIIFGARLARQAYVDALARATANLSRHHGCTAAQAAHAIEPYEDALARATARLAVSHLPEEPRPVRDEAG